MLTEQAVKEVLKDAKKQEARLEKFLYGPQPDKDPHSKKKAYPMTEIDNDIQYMEDLQKMLNNILCMDDISQQALRSLNRTTHYLGILRHYKSTGQMKAEEQEWNKGRDDLVYKCEYVDPLEFFRRGGLTLLAGESKVTKSTSAFCYLIQNSNCIAYASDAEVNEQKANMWRKSLGMPKEYLNWVRMDNIKTIEHMVSMIERMFKKDPYDVFFIDPPRSNFFKAGLDEEQVRNTLTALQKVAVKLNVAIIVTRHLNKSEDQKEMLNKISGSVLLRTIPRSVVGMIKAQPGSYYRGSEKMVSMMFQMEDNDGEVSEWRNKCTLVKVDKHNQYVEFEEIKVSLNQMLEGCKPSNKKAEQKEAEDLIVDTLLDNGGRMQASSFKILLSKLLLNQGKPASGPTIKRHLARLKNKIKCEYGDQHKRYYRIIQEDKSGFKNL